MIPISFKTGTYGLFIILAIRRPKKEDCKKSEANLSYVSYIERLCLKQNKQTNSMYTGIHYYVLGAPELRNKCSPYPNPDLTVPHQQL